MVSSHAPFSVKSRGQGKSAAIIVCRNCFHHIRKIGGADYDNHAGFIGDPDIACVQSGGKA